MKILTAEQMREVDRRTMEDIGIPGTILMENAGIHVVEIMEEHFEHFGSLKVAVVSGRGNNGGDGFVIARQLYMRGMIPHVFLTCPSEELKGEARANFEILQRYREIPIYEIPDEEALNALDISLDAFQVIVDAILGTGLREPVEGYLGTVIQAINSSPANIVAVDIPSGLFADEYRPVENAVFADITVTFTAPKPGLLLGEAYSYVGDLYTVSIGSPDFLLETPEHSLNVITPEDFEILVMPRKKDTHKGNYGHVLIAGGSTGKTGAVRMAGLAALRTGAGLVTVAVPDEVAGFVNADCPELMTERVGAEGFRGKGASDRLLALLANRDLLALGPGLGTDDATAALVLDLIPRLDVPAVLDADALTCLAKDKSVLEKAHVPLVLTPHPGEMARLLGCSTGDVQEDREGISTEFARKYGVYLILKGFRTVVAEPDGQVWINLTGNPGMATAGSGDVLSGILGAFCARINHRNAEAWGMACRAGVHIHGLAGDLASKEVSEESLIAGDIIRFIGAAIRQVKEEE